MNIALHLHAKRHIDSPVQLLADVLLLLATFTVCIRMTSGRRAPIVFSGCGVSGLVG